MIYPQRDNRRKKKKLVTTTVVIALVLFTITLLNIFNPSLLTPVVQTVGRPILEARGGFLGGIASAWRFLHGHGVLVGENTALKEKLALMSAIELERDYYKEQNAELLRRVGRMEVDEKRTLARIISKPGFSPYDTIIIDAGKDEGLNPGDHVMADSDTLLGEISQSFKNTSTVLLYSTSEHQTPVLIGTSSLQALAVGRGGGTYEIKLPRNTGVAVGDMVVFASSSAKIMGKIEVINTSATDSFERALFKNLIDVSAISLVTVQKQ
jgi:cell shape-determining protein MreC